MTSEMLTGDRMIEVTVPEDKWEWFHRHPVFRTAVETVVFIEDRRADEVLELEGFGVDPRMLGVMTHAEADELEELLDTHPDELHSELDTLDDAVLDD